MAATDTEISSRLQASAARALGGSPEISGLCRLSGGASQESWWFELTGTDATEALVLRRAPPGRKSAGFSTVNLATEAQLLRLAGQAAVPVPALRWQLDASDELGEGYVMQALRGETLPKKILHEPVFAQARVQLARECGETLARLHAVPVDTVNNLPALPARAQLQQLRTLYDGFGEARPVLELAMQWLDEHAAENPTETLVHGDFRNGNLMVGEQGLRAVLDWELAHRGDPMEDLGWLCVNSWRFGQIDNPVGGFGQLAQLREGYESVAGRTIDEARIRYWQVFGSFKWGIICLAQAFTHLSGQSRSVELAAIGRRVSEAELDLLLLLHSRESLAPFKPEQYEQAPRPSAADLSEAVAEYLREQAAPALQGRAAFHAKVAANASSIIAREAALGPAAAREETERLRALLGKQAPRAELNRQLCQAIRGARLGAQTPGMIDHLWATTHARMAIDQPGYASYRRLVE